MLAGSFKNNNKITENAAANLMSSYCNYKCKFTKKDFCAMYSHHLEL